MKKYISIILTGVLLVASSCDGDFAEINTDPNRADGEVFDPNLILPTVSANYSNMMTGYTGAILFQSMWVQVMASTSTGGANYYSNADKYVASGSTNSYIQSVWNDGYSSASRVYQMQKLAEEKGYSNLVAVGEIWKVLTLSFVSDIYGDLPYSEALLAEEGITQPKYDPQSEAYMAMLSDLESALSSINESGDPIRNDVLYDGDLTKWKKLGYSIMLRMAMRMVDVDPASAQSYVQKAIAGGVFSSTDDEAVLASDQANGYANSSANALNVTDDVYEVRWSDKLINFLKANDDPRLSVIAEVPVAGLAGNRSTEPGNNAPEDQLGLPNGYDLRGGATDVSNAPNYPGGTGSGDDLAPIGNYSRPTAIYRDRDAPVFILTYAEIQFLLADAAARGYSVPMSAAEHYEAGLEAAMVTIGKFGGASVSASDAASFVAANPLDTSSAEASLQMINEQIWATTGILANFVESWNNWKRSGYPELTPVNYTGNFSQGQIPRRQLYPSSESTTNPENLANAISSMGGDTWTTTVWWDN
ncbi:SusD/RagB family nutrient-binding outer membrane lipoprotein [Algoriphagus halophytocola]|uniref:SusD/RagB family nutrient-binding outer membrane lipoprotein n=1 Tax=Algoriphagus halophytocola TaxID=2991499 RepID=A0ABY6MPB9_9BACT|nr:MULTISPECIES: SusD/RagB family nutrient-binding outer membrane lipoprotein [unclassified Algoriphagus]UZD24054.1 SusD/RagB family nutrient-binding outer membrane lipoprotein [Algoriphagus sp. TR-M5]WBL41426.1 SusD/RagB family nutrient-binding outer membrane lipoprotein [Algoriphagus sp. TR-M9]